MPPLPADFIHARDCKLKCEKFLTRPKVQVVLKYNFVLDFNVSRIVYLGEKPSLKGSAFIR